MCLWASAGRQTPSPAKTAPQAQATEGKPVERLQFSSDAAIVTYFVRSGAVNEFRKIVGDWRDKAVASADPQIAQQLRGWKLYEAAERGPRDSVVLKSVIYPVIQGADYALPVDRNFNGSSAAAPGAETLIGLSRNELTLVEDFGKGVPQQPTGTVSPPGAPSSESPFVFFSDAAVLTLFVKSDRISGFEQVVHRVHEGLVASRRPIRLEQAAGWKLFRSKEGGPSGTVLYLSLIAPVVKGAEVLGAAGAAGGVPAGGPATAAAVSGRPGGAQQDRAPAARGLQRASDSLDRPRVRSIGEIPGATRRRDSSGAGSSKRQVHAHREPLRVSVNRVVPEAEDPVVDSQAQRTGEIDFRAAADVGPDALCSMSSDSKRSLK